MGQERQFTAFQNVVSALFVETLTNIAETTLENLREFDEGKRGAELTNAVRIP